MLRKGASLGFLKFFPSNGGKPAMVIEQTIGDDVSRIFIECHDEQHCDDLLRGMYQLIKLHKTPSEKEFINDSSVIEQ